MNQKYSNSDARKQLTYVASVRTISSMARLKDILSGLAERINKERDSLVAANDELRHLREAANRLRELEASVKAREESFRIGLALMLRISDEGEIGAWGKSLDQLEEEAGVFLDDENVDLDSFPLWKIMREILKQTSEIRVYEVEKHLQSFGLKTSRQAIESALKTRKDVFRVTRRGREVLVSLK